MKYQMSAVAVSSGFSFDLFRNVHSYLRSGNSLFVCLVALVPTLDNRHSLLFVCFSWRAPFTQKRILTHGSQIAQMERFKGTDFHQVEIVVDIVQILLVEPPTVQQY